MDFYKKLLAHKAINKLSWNEIGKVINKEQATIRIAVQRKSLTKLEIRELENFFFLEKSITSKYNLEQHSDEQHRDSVDEDIGNYAQNELFFEFNGIKVPIGIVADFVAQHYELSKQASDVLNLKIEKEHRDYLIKYLTDQGFKVTLPKNE